MGDAAAPDMLRKLIHTSLAALVALPLFAVTVGQLQPGGGTVASRGGTLAPLTLIDLSRPALSAGNVTRATVVWAGGGGTPCSNAFEVKFFRPTETGLSVVASRGPFSASAGILNVPLSPAVSLLPGDYIGITQLQPLACGGVVNARTEKKNVIAAVPSDPDSGTVADIEFVNGLVMSARASSELTPVYAYIPVVGSTQGGFGSLFRTAMQLTNRGTTIISGQLVFHPAGRGGASSDPNYIYTLAPSETLSIDNILAEMGTTGVGSLDIIPTTGYPPDVTARIYNDEGAAGTSGFTEEAMSPYEAMYPQARGSLTIPSDLGNFRMNIGIRTLEDGADIRVVHFNAVGDQIGSAVTRSYPANYFEQVTLADFLEGQTVAAGGSIVVLIQSGSAFLYGSVTDNRTNDSAIRFPKQY